MMRKEQSKPNVCTQETRNVKNETSNRMNEPKFVIDDSLMIKNNSLNLQNRHSMSIPVNVGITQRTYDATCSY